MPTPGETILAALHARLSALPATVLRGEVLPERIPAEGLPIPRDGEPGGARGDAVAARLPLSAPGRGLVTVPMFILVPQVTIRKRLEVAGATERWVSRLPSLVVRNWISDEDGSC